MVDLRVSRIFKMNEHARLQASLDLFNLFNRNNVDEVFTVYGSALFTSTGQPGGMPLPVPQRYGDGIGSPFIPSFGSPRTILNPRQLQFSAKLLF
jgi:hypothetical protein